MTIYNLRKLGRLHISWGQIKAGIWLERPQICRYCDFAEINQSILRDHEHKHLIRGDTQIRGEKIQWLQ